MEAAIAFLSMKVAQINFTQYQARCIVVQTIHVQPKIARLSIKQRFGQVIALWFVVNPLSHFRKDFIMSENSRNRDLDELLRNELEAKPCPFREVAEQGAQPSNGAHCGLIVSLMKEFNDDHVRDDPQFTIIPEDTINDAALVTWQQCGFCCSCTEDNFFRKIYRDAKTKTPDESSPKRQRQNMAYSIIHKFADDQSKTTSSGQYADNQDVAKTWLLLKQKAQQNLDLVVSFVRQPNWKNHDSDQVKQKYKQDGFCKHRKQQRMGANGTAETIKFKTCRGNDDDLVLYDCDLSNDGPASNTTKVLKGHASYERCLYCRQYKSKSNP